MRRRNFFHGSIRARGFCSAGRIVLLLTSENGFLQLHAAIDELRRALKRLLDLDVSAGISKEHAPDADFHEAYKEAMEALKTAETESGFCAADGQSGIDPSCAEECCKSSTRNIWTRR